jgi:hypothetical protein
MIPFCSPLAQRQEAIVLGTIQCGFESHGGYHYTRVYSLTSKVRGPYPHVRGASPREPTMKYLSQEYLLSVYNMPVKATCSYCGQMFKANDNFKTISAIEAYHQFCYDKGPVTPTAERTDLKPAK